MNATVPAAAPTSVAAPAAPVPKVRPADAGELILVTLAREIAMDIQPLESILKNHEVDDARWAQIQANTRFQQLLRSQVEEWNSALNTAERVKLKALACVEEALPEFYKEMHNSRETLPARVRALEVIGNMGGVGKNAQVVGGSGEKFSVTINLGADNQLKISAPTPMGTGDQ